MNLSIGMNNYQAQLVDPDDGMVVGAWLGDGVLATERYFSKAATVSLAESAAVIADVYEACTPSGLADLTGVPLAGDIASALVAIKEAGGLMPGPYGWSIMLVDGAFALSDHAKGKGCAAAITVAQAAATTPLAASVSMAMSLEFLNQSNAAKRLENAAAALSKSDGCLMETVVGGREELDGLWLVCR